VPAWLVVNGSDVALPSAPMSTVLVKIAAPAQVSSPGP
jgi:hypothetical protein